MTPPRLRHATGTLALVAILAVPGCGRFAGKTDATFGDQNFKTAVALIELYHVRHGAYPATLRDIDFTGGWDALALSSVKYERLPDGYTLEIERGWVGKPALSYPPEFWRGLGIRRTNVGNGPGAPAA